MSPRIQTRMELEEVKPNKPNVPLVGILFAVGVLVILAGIAIVVYWRARQVKTPPYTKHPISMLNLPGHTPGRA